MFNFLKPNQCFLKNGEQYAAVCRLARVRAQRLALAVEEDELTAQLRTCMFDAQELVDPAFLRQQLRAGTSPAELSQMWVARITDDGHRLEIHPAFVSQRFRPVEEEEGSEDSENSENFENSENSEDSENSENSENSEYSENSEDSEDSEAPSLAEEKGEKDDEEKRSKKEEAERETREDPPTSPHLSSHSTHVSTLPTQPSVTKNDLLPAALRNLASIPHHSHDTPPQTTLATPQATTPQASAQPAAQPTLPPAAARSNDPNIVHTRRDDIYVDKFISFWNRTTEGTRIPKMQTLQGRRLELLRARTSEVGGAVVIEVIHRAMQSSFLRGESSCGWVVSVDWLLKPDNFCRIQEGVYDDRPKNARQRSDEQQAQRREANRAIEQQMTEELHASIEQRQRRAATVDQIKAILGDHWMLD